MNNNLTFGKRLARAMKHALSTPKAGRLAFPEATLLAIEAAIADGERLHRAEVRLIVEHGLDLRAAFGGISNRQRACALFAQYGIWDTEENCGVLIYINLAEQKVDIVADRNIGKRIAAQQWQGICRMLTDAYAGGEFHASTLAALATLNDLLRQHLPATGARNNQLPNAAIVL